MASEDSAVSCVDKGKTISPAGTPVKESEDNKLSDAAKVNPNEKVDLWRTTPDSGVQLSKNQLKKKRRWEKLVDIKKRRKLQDKEAKVAKAVAEGRDLEEERRLMAERAREGTGHERRVALWRQRLKDASGMFRICLDCAFDSQMSVKEINSLASQIRYCYAANKRALQPCQFSVASLSGATLAHLQKVSGFPDQWTLRAFSCSEKSLVDMHSDRVADLVYLTSDSETVLTELDDSKIYIIGGIVDRNRLKRAAFNRATDLGIATARLPLEQHLHMVTTKVLTCNHVFEILMKYREHKDWKRALLDVLPQRKDAKEKDDQESDNDDPTNVDVEKPSHFDNKPTESVESI